MPTRTRGRQLALSLLICAMVCGCSPQALMHKFASPEDEPVAQKYLGCLRSHDIEEIAKVADRAARVRRRSAI